MSGAKLARKIQLVRQGIYAMIFSAPASTAP